MAELKPEQRIIRQVLEELVGVEARGFIRYEAVFDDERGRYQIIAIGWEDNQQILKTVALIELRNDLIWLQADNTDYGIAEELVRLGIPKSRIVLGFQPPQWRQHTGFAQGD